MAARPPLLSRAPLSSTWQASRGKSLRIRFPCPTLRASSESLERGYKFYEQLGSVSLKSKLEDAVLRAEKLASKALEIEEATRIKQEEVVREHNIWHDPIKSTEIFGKFVDIAKMVDSLKDLKYKAEEVKLIMLLAEKEAIKNGFVKQAYDASVDVCRFLDQYEMRKLLKGPYDLEGACVIIKARSKSHSSEMWAKELLTMYNKWAERQGYRGRVVEKCSSKLGGVMSVTIEFEHEFTYGYLSGERGLHCMIRNQDGPVVNMDVIADVDVIPLLLGSVDLEFDEKDLAISSPTPEEQLGQFGPAVCIQHIPTGISVLSSGERSHFANKIKALNRLKAKLLVTAKDQGVSGVNSIKTDAGIRLQHQLIRRYIFEPYKLVEDVKTGVQLLDLNSVLDGYIEPLIGAHLKIRQETRCPY